MTVRRRPASARPTRTAVVPLSSATASPSRSTSATAAAIRPLASARSRTRSANGSSSPRMSRLMAPAANPPGHAHRHDPVQVAADGHLGCAELLRHVRDVKSSVPLQDLHERGQPRVPVHSANVQS